MRWRGVGITAEYDPLPQSYLISHGDSYCFDLYLVLCPVCRSEVELAIPKFHSNPSSSFTVSTHSRGLLPLTLSLWISGNSSLFTLVSLLTSKYCLVCNVTVSRTSSCSFISVFSRFLRAAFNHTCIPVLIGAFSLYTSPMNVSFMGETQISTRSSSSVRIGRRGRRRPRIGPHTAWPICNRENRYGAHRNLNTYVSNVIQPRRRRLTRSDSPTRISP